MRKVRSVRRGNRSEADRVLRYISRKHPRSYAYGHLRRHVSIDDFEWLETQMGTAERRLDRALLVVMGDERRVLHAEWATRWTRHAMDRGFEYHNLFAIEAGWDARAKSVKGKPPVEPARVDSFMVVLTGSHRKKPTTMVRRTSSDDVPFCGVEMRVEFIYQRTVAEVEAMGGLFWLVFVPLAVDVDEGKLDRVLRRIERQTKTEEAYADLLAAMTILARLNKRNQHLADVLESRAKRENVAMKNCFFVEGKKEGKKEGKREGQKQGQLAILAHLLERRIKRSLTEAERARLAARLDKDGPDNLGDVVLDLSPDEIESWLAPRKAKAA